MATTARPNVIWVFGDQHRAQSLGISGDPNLHTPNLDRLAMEGLRLRGVSGFPLCCAYRGSLVTSRYPHECVPGHEYPIPENTPTVATAFRQAGYHTTWIGKWHLGGFKERQGRAVRFVVPRDRRGDFDTWIGYENNNAQWETLVHGHRRDSAGAAEVEVPMQGVEGYETDGLTDRFIAELELRSRMKVGEETQPFFAALSVQPPHDPFVAPQQWMARHHPAGVKLRPNVPLGGEIEKRARQEYAGYCSMIENLDWNLGRIRDALQRLGLADHTHIIFFSDHGEMAGSQGAFRKTSPYAESIDVPMILGGVSLYGLGRGERPCLVNHVDIAPTSLGLCGIDKPAWMRGTDFSRHRTPGRPTVSEPDSAYLQSVIPTGHADSIDRAWRGIVTRDGWKFVCFERQPWLLFDLNEDPYEMANLAFNTRYAQQRRKLFERTRAWAGELGDSFDLGTL